METPNKTISWPEILLLIGIAISILLPRTYLPFGLLAIGGFYLLNLIFHSVRTGSLPRATFGPATAALFSLIFGVCLLTFTGDPLSALIITITATLVVHMAWVIWRNRLSRR